MTANEHLQGCAQPPQVRQGCKPDCTPGNAPLPQLLTALEQAAFVLQVSTERAEQAALWSFRALEELIPYLGNSDDAERLRDAYSRLRERFGQKE